MSVFLVTWDLNKEKPDYASARARVLARINQYENTKDSGLDSVRFVSTSKSADAVSDDIRTALDKNDRLVVTKLVADLPAIFGPVVFRKWLDPGWLLKGSV